MQILITGGSGFIGSHLVEYFQGRAAVRVLDDLSSGFRSNLAGLDCDLIEASILDRDAVRAAMRGVDYVFHLAAMISVPASMENPVRCAQTNTIGTLFVLEEAARARVKKLILSSSAAIYGNNPVLPKREEMNPEPASPYAISKLDAEYYCRLFTATRGLPTVALRYFNVFGPRQNPSSAYAAAIPIFIHRALRHQPVTIHGDGGQTRDFISVRDVARANAFFATECSLPGVFNVARGHSISIRDLAFRILLLTGSSSGIIYGPERPGDVRDSVACLEKLTGAGFTPAAGFEEALRETIDSCRTTSASPAND
jgi:UDP-glucose 4-epimerase